MWICVFLREFGTKCIIIHTLTQPLNYSRAILGHKKNIDDIGAGLVASLFSCHAHRSAQHSNKTPKLKLQWSINISFHFRTTCWLDFQASRIKTASTNLPSRDVTHKQWSILQWSSGVNIVSISLWKMKQTEVRPVSMGADEPGSCSYFSQSLDGRSSTVCTAADSRLFTLVAMATITELKSGKSSLYFMVLLFGCSHFTLTSHRGKYTTGPVTAWVNPELLTGVSSG